MTSPEVFYLHLAGEQRGPYTVPQIDHLLNSGLIGEETLYWREGLEQWAPVTSLVPKRVRERPWGTIVAGLVVLAALGLLAAFIGPVLVDGWREANQHVYTKEAAYWRAREIVRSQKLPGGAVVTFADFAEAEVTLAEPAGATVDLRGDLIEGDGAARLEKWRVEMQFDPKLAEWSAAARAEDAPAEDRAGLE